MTIWFDMDGTLADLYGVPDWLDKLENNDTTPYEQAKPLLNMQALARVLHRLQRNGYQIGIISWTARDGNAEYNQAVATAKANWLNKHLHSVSFDHLDIIDYGTPKSEGRTGILFDDEQGNRKNWKGITYDVENIIQTLRQL